MIILTTMLGEFVLDFIASRLNMRTLTDLLPDEFAKTFDTEAYKKSQEYSRTRLRFGLLSSTVSLAVTLLFWFAEGFNYLDHLVRGWAFGNLMTGVSFVGILVLIRSILFLPFTLYSIFVIEERFGFNKMTVRIFILDTLKGTALAIILGGPILLGVLWFFETAGSLAWLYCWVTATIFMLIIQYVAPTWIMPLFNKFVPLREGELREEILKLAKSVNFSLKDVVVMDGSKRSKKSNAFFTGFGNNKRIALFDTLIERHTVPELVSVMAHEIGHYKKRHILQSMVIGIVHTGAMLYLLSLFVSRKELFDAFFMDTPSVYAGLLLFGMLLAPIEFLLSLAMNVLSRRNEFEADRYAAETYNRPQTMIDALKKLTVDNLSHLTPHPLYVFLNYSHPPVLKRIEALRILGGEG